MIVSELFKRHDVESCIHDLVAIHRQHYHEPGYILDSKKLYSNYENVVSLIMEQSYTKDIHTINFIELDTKTFELRIQDKLLRDWFVNNSRPFEHLGQFDLKLPNQITTHGAIIEILYEVTFYSFPEETVDN